LIIVACLLLSVQAATRLLVSSILRAASTTAALFFMNNLHPGPRALVGPGLDPVLAQGQAGFRGFFIDSPQ
jgi:hypothetical protein